jgi:hypothetical protein
MKVAKYLGGAVLALGLFLTAVAVGPAKADSFAPADPHGGVSASHGFYVTYEVQLGFTNRATGQTWNEGYTYTRWYDFNWRLVNDSQAQAIYAHIRDMDAQGWTWTYNSGAGGEPVIAQGTW